MPRTPRKPRPGPLQELPLAHFITSSDTVHDNPFRPGSKRLRSPSASVLLSPAKKRLIREDRLFPSLDPNTSLRRTGTSGQSLNSNFSPSRRLDFNAPKAGAALTLDDYSTSYASRHCKQVVFSSKASAASSDHAERTSVLIQCKPGCNALKPAPVLIPRELPPSPNRQSIDYPGFDVLRDAFVESATTSSRLQASDNEDFDTELMKENVPPRVRPKKAASAPDRIGSLTFSPKGKSKLSASSFPVTPQELCHETPVTPRANRTPGLVTRSMTPGWTPRVEGPYSSRRALEREVDEHCSEDDFNMDGTL